MLCCLVAVCNEETSTTRVNGFSGRLDYTRTMVVIGRPWQWRVHRTLHIHVFTGYCIWSGPTGIRTQGILLAKEALFR